jgi:PAS domain S-box-containing protein
MQEPSPLTMTDITRQILDQACEGIIVCDCARRYRVWNRYMEAMSGVCAQEVLGKTPEEAFPHLDSPELRGYIARALAGETFTVPDKEYISEGTGQPVWVTCKYTPLYDETGKVTGLLCTVSDISERRKSEESLRRSEARYRALVEGTSAAVWRQNPAESQPPMDWWLELTGQTPEENTGWGWLDALHPDDRALARETWERASTTLTPYRVSYRIRTRSVSYRYFDVIGVPVKNEDGSLREWIGTFNDVTAQKEAEQALERSRQQFADLVNTVDGIVWEADANSFNFTFVSPQAERILGYPLARWLEEPHFWSSHILPDDREHAVQYCLKATAELRDHNFEYRMLAADGRIVWLHDVVSVTAEAEKPVILRGLMVDITERKQLEEQLLQSQKMESIGRLAGGVAHDFNNLLTAILGYTELARENLADREQAQEFLRMAQEASARAASLTDQLLAFARKRIIAPQVTDLNALLRHVETLLQRLIGEHITLAVRCGAGLWPVLVDTGQIEQVIVNLAVNARDAMPQGGTLTIETANMVLSAEEARRFTGLLPGDYVRVTVSDTGIGIEESVRRHIFEPFFTTKPYGKGTGLGLAMCLGIVQQSGGVIWCDSAAEAGTTFVIYLPRADGTEERLTMPEVREKPRGSETVLVAEDETLVREIAVTTLRAQGYAVLEADSGVDALQIAEAHAGPIHLLLTDVVMPQMGGVELAERLAVTRPGIRVLYASGYTENTVVHEGIAEEGIAFLAKPYSPSQLARKVRQTLDEESRD